MTKPQPRRKNMRLQGFDYRSSVYYFVTICSYRREWVFECPEAKRLLELTWKQIPTWPQSAHVHLDDFVVMPNHKHSILAFTDDSLADIDFDNPPRRLEKSLGSVVATYKKMVTKRLRNIFRDPDLKVWQRGYYDRIIRDESELNRIREYIRLNPERWREDVNYEEKFLDRVLEQMNYQI